MDSATRSAGPAAPTPSRGTRAIVVSAVWFALFAIASSQSFAQLAARDPGISLASVLVWQAPIWLFWALATPGVLWLARKAPLRPGAWAWSVPLHIVVASVLACLHLIVFGYASVVLAPFALEADPDSWGGFGLVSRDSVLVRYLSYAAILALGLGLDAFDAYREREWRAIQLEAQLSRARLDMLRMQIRPHFLFNALNTVSMMAAPGARQSTGCVCTHAS